jgi:hypothetical protein
MIISTSFKPKNKSVIKSTEYTENNNKNFNSSDLSPPKKVHSLSNPSEIEKTLYSSTYSEKAVFIEEENKNSSVVYNENDGYLIEIPVRQSTTFRIPIKNQEKNAKTFNVLINNPELIKVPQGQVLVQPGSDKTLDLEIVPQERPGTKECHLAILDGNDTYLCYKVSVSVTL